MTTSHSIDLFGAAEIMQSLEIIVDNREQRTPKAKERYDAFGVPYSKATLDYGDYCANVRLQSGEWLYDTSDRIRPICVIERKMSLDELAGCFGRGRERFQRELERAKDNRAKVYLLVENGSFEGIMFHRYRSALTTNAFLASLTAWMARYDLGVVFCKSDVSGRLIKEILYRDMKERVESLM